MLNFTTLPPLSLYIHYPWCAQKCPYCDFNSHTAASGKNKKQDDQAYVDALIRDLEGELPSIWGRTVQTVFIGGGTPSLMQPEAMEQLLSHIRARINLSPLAEITMEANPGTVDQRKFADFYAAGVNRLSMGIQSFDDVLLAKIGRIHDSQQACYAIEQAQNAGFSNINLDLMYALPGQNLASAVHDMQQAISFKPAHISHYQLTIEANTLFASRPPPLPDDELSYDMQLDCQQILADAGYQHYEISAYAQAGKQCRHNLNYWQFGDYLGIGAGAHGKISNACEQHIFRRWKEKHPQSYLEIYGSVKKIHKKAEIIANSSMLGGEQQLGHHDIGFEFMLNSSRLIDGFDSQLFSARTGLPIAQIQAGLDKAIKLELIAWHGQRIKPTRRGLQYLNELQEIFL